MVSSHPQATANSHPKATANSRRKVMANNHLKVTANSHHKVTALLLVNLVHLSKAMANSHLHQVSMASSARPKEVPVDIQVSNSMANRHQVAGTRSGVINLI
jgi:hypothetical protein